MPSVCVQQLTANVRAAAAVVPLAEPVDAPEVTRMWVGAINPLQSRLQPYHSLPCTTAQTHCFDR